MRSLKWVAVHTAQEVIHHLHDMHAPTCGNAWTPPAGEGIAARSGTLRSEGWGEITSSLHAP